MDQEPENGRESNGAKRSGKGRKRRRISRLLILAGAAMIIYYVIVNWVPKWYREYTYYKNLASLDLPVSSVSSYTPSSASSGAGTSSASGSGSASASEAPSADYPSCSYPSDSFFKTLERQNYQDGDMTLIVPRLALETKVMNGTTNDVLKRGVGLYSVSPLPSYGNPNVCIAGHRGVYGAEFYNIDKFQEGDLIYLVYNGYRFTYKYVETVVVDPTDWSMIYCTDYSAITLTSCHPMDTSAYRMCVRGQLVRIDAVGNSG